MLNNEFYHVIYVETTYFNLVMSFFFKKVVEAVVEAIRNYGRDYFLPSYNKARVTYKQKEVEMIDNMDMEKYN